MGRQWEKKDVFLEGYRKIKLICVLNVKTAEGCQPLILFPTIEIFSLWDQDYCTEIWFRVIQSRASSSSWSEREGGLHISTLIGSSYSMSWEEQEERKFYRPKTRVLYLFQTVSVLVTIHHPLGVGGPSAGEKRWCCHLGERIVVNKLDNILVLLELKILLELCPCIIFFSHQLRD